MTPELHQNLEFAALDVQPSEVVALALFAAAAGTAVALAVMAIGFLIGELLLLAFAAAVPLCAYTFAGWYPKWRAERARVQGLGEVPILVSYMVMSMKVVPNLERSAKFAAEHVDGPLGRNLRDSLWQVYTRVRNGIDEALVKFANRWANWCEDFKRSIHLIRASTSEREGRLRTLDRALEISLHGIRERMQQFASGLHLPTLLIYSIGVLLPLVLVATLPVLSAMGMGIGTWHAFTIYCIALPIVVYMLSKWVLAKRPAAFQPPEVPNKTNRVRIALLAIGVGLAVTLPVFWFHLPPLVRSLSILWGLALTVALYLHLTTARAFEQRNSIKQMEREFCDSLVQLGNRIAEGRPAEDAFEHVAESMRGSTIARVYRQASANIRFGGMGLRVALFDPERGALREVRSRTIHSTLHMLVDTIERSTRTAGAAILRTADHLKELRGVEADIRRSLGEVVTSMRSVALFFAPLVAAVAGCLQGTLTSKTAATPFLGAGASVSPPVFLLMLGVYVALLTAILISYATEIEAGSDSLLKRVMIARALLISISVFTVGVVLGGQLLTGLLG